MRPGIGVLNGGKEIASLELRILRYCPWREHGCGRNALGLQAPHHVICFTGLSPCLHMRIKRIGVLVAPLWRGKPRVTRPGLIDDGAQSRPLRLRPHGNRYSAILAHTAIGAMRRVPAIPVAPALGQLARHTVFQNLLANKTNARLLQG